MTTIDDNPSSADLPARVYTDDEALEDLLSIGRTSMTGSALARQWGWNDMRVSRRLRAWEESGLITRRNGEIVTAVAAITPKYQPLNTRANVPADMTDRWSDNLSLRFVAFGLFLTGAAINGFHTFSQGANSILILGYTIGAGWLLMFVGILADVAAYSLPDTAAVRWRQGHHATSALAWLICIPLVTFAFLNNTGFTTTNLSDTANARAERSTPALDEAKRNLDDAKRARDTACTGRDGKPAVGPVCAQTNNTVDERQRRVDGIRDRITADANPQSAKTASLIRWATFGHLSPSVDDIANLFLLLFAALPLSGGLIRMVAGRR